MENNKPTYSIKDLCTFIGLVTAALLVFYGYKNGLFSSAAIFKDSIIKFGVWAALVFILIQISQVILPIIPGALGCVAGVFIFGNWMGLLYNYIGICIGSIVVFMLSKRYGRPFVKKFVGGKLYEKYLHRVESGKKFDTLFAWAIFFPLAPDDLLCYLAGLTEMKFRKFATIILLGKPLSISLYSMGMTATLRHLMALIK